MSKEKNILDVHEIETKPKTTEALYTKEQILSSKKYSRRKDVLNVVLKDNRQYTLKEVDGLIDNFMKIKEKGKVK